MSDEPVMREPAPQKDDFFKRMLDAVIDLLETARDWLRQEVEGTVREKVVLPLQRLGLTLASGCASAMLLAVGVIFLAVAAVIGLGSAIGYGWTFFAIGMVLLVGSGVFLVIKVRSMQR